MIRDTHSKALVETDLSELQKYRKDKRKEKEFQELRQEVYSLKLCINNLNEAIKKIEARV